MIDFEFIKLLITPLTGALITISIFLIQDRERKISRALQYYDQYYNTDFYYNVISPSQEVIQFWNRCEDVSAKREIVRGWISSEYFSRVDTLSDDYVKNYYSIKNDRGGYSTHQALAVYIWFWFKISQLIKTGFIHRKTALMTLKYGFSIREKFLIEFSELLKEEIMKSDRKPISAVWTADITYLSKIFRNTT